jgi:hypothetical protein
MSKTSSKAKKSTTTKEKKPVRELKFDTEIELKDAKILLRPSKRKTVKKVKVVLEGNLSIINSKNFLKEIAPTFEDYDYIDFFLDNPTALDLSFIQSLYHLKTYYANQNKNVTIDSELPAEMKKVVVNSGFEDLIIVPKLV